MKSKKGDSKAFLWVLFDRDGEMKALCFEAKTPVDAMTDGFLSASMKHCRAAFTKSGPVRVSGLIDTKGKPLMSATGLVG